MCSPEKVQGLTVSWSATVLFLYGLTTLVLASEYLWALQWLLSGGPILQFVLLLGSSLGYRILPFFSLWSLIATTSLLYFISATSWLFYWIFAAVCYPVIFLTCLFQFDLTGKFVRGSLRRLLKTFHFIDDRIAFFDLPALEIDTEVDGLMVIRGLTLHITTLSIVAHGIEVGIKLSDDMEIAIQCEKATVSSFRRIDIGDCFANIKGGEYEMTFGNLEQRTKDADADAVMVTDTPLLRAATLGANSTKLKRGDTLRAGLGSMKMKMRNVMTDGAGPEDSTPEDGLESATPMPVVTEEALEKYQTKLNYLEATNTVHEARLHVKAHVEERDDAEGKFKVEDRNAMRAAICSQLHNQSSVPHPPKKSIKVTTIQNMIPQKLRELLHRLPMLLRVLLNSLSYFHPVNISSITATGSGKFIKKMLAEKVFEGYGKEDSEIKDLERKVSEWLSEANFAFELADVEGQAQVPIVTTYDINCLLSFGDVIAYRALPKKVDLKQVIRLGGADAKFRVPTFLLPHHEHLLPPKPTKQHLQDLKKNVDTYDGDPKTLEAHHDLEQAEKDQTNVHMAIHARLPAILDQELLNFISSLVKANKIIELVKEPDPMDKEIHGFKEFSKAIDKKFKEGLKKTALGGMVNDRWIARLVGRITKKLEAARGDVGYKGVIEVQLGPYRSDGREKEKLLP